MIGYFTWFALRNLHADALAALASPTLACAVIVAALLYTTIVPVTAWAWVRLLSGVGERWTTVGLARLIGITQIAKYVPGNIAQHATRAALSLRSEMTPTAFAATVIQETALTVCASVGVGLLALGLSTRGLAQLPGDARGSLILLAAALLALTLTLAIVRKRVDCLRNHRSGWLRILSAVARLPQAATTTIALAAYALNFVTVGLALWLVARAIGLPVEVDLALVTASFALSWTLGFLAPGAPAGLGVREGIMLLLLHGSAPGDELLLFVLMCRVVTMLGDGLCFAVASFTRGQIRRQVA
ncbi:lysylphosphatidylglycerol synthase domain-containing protein [Lysobacter sp. A03]|uniref:lysylphosphatidylglycerol synthase domain-containing protein n=1 Tax=Lysobacter sp. A03 TaxID=1199154 RepID=UPI0005B7009E|nr:lysylphosphatidylglycerol synthase domain-containing protein [Lysobacter sp. A03]KIQ97420.1 hypothetical protein TI01_1027 [Lysobacter sp. A03]